MATRRGGCRGVTDARQERRYGQALRAFRAAWGRVWAHRGAPRRTRTGRRPARRHQSPRMAKRAAAPRPSEQSPRTSPPAHPADPRPVRAPPRRPRPGQRPTHVGAPGGCEDRVEDRVERTGRGRRRVRAARLRNGPGSRPPVKVQVKAGHSVTGGHRAGGRGFSGFFEWSPAAARL